MTYTKQIIFCLAILLLFPGIQLWAENYALEFDGTDDFLYLGEGVPVLGTTFTQELWIYSEAGTNSGFNGILGFEGTNAAGRSRPPSIYLHEGTKIHYGFGDGTKWYATTTDTSVLAQDTWNHIAVTFDGTNYILYVNGTQEHSITSSGADSLTGKTPINLPIKWIGKIDNFFEGQIDEVRIWDVALSATDIQASWNKRINNPEDEANLIGYWNFDQQSTGNVLDLKSTNHGVLSAGQIRVVSTNTVLEDLPEATQLLTVIGQVTGELGTSTKVRLVTSKGYDSEEILTASGEEFRFIILDLGNTSQIPSYLAGDVLTITITDTSDANNTQILDTVQHTLTSGEISSGVVQLTSISITVSLPQIGVNSSFAFGDIYAGSNSNQLTISNTGDAELTISQIVGSAGLTASPDSLTIAAGGTGTIDLSLVVDAAYAGSSSLTITSDSDGVADTSTVVNVTAKLLLPTINLASTIDLGSFYVGLTNSVEISIGNDGLADLRISQISVGETSGLEVLANYPIIIAPGSSQQIPVNLLAETVGDYSQTVTVYSNDQQSPGPETEVTITATIVEAPAISSSQMLVVVGDYLGIESGQLTIQILDGPTVETANEVTVYQKTANVENGSYRIYLLDLSNPDQDPNLGPGLGKFNSQNYIRLELSAADGAGVIVTRQLEVGEIDLGLVEQDLEVLLQPEISVEANFDFGDIYISLINAFEITVSNDGQADLEISQIGMGETSGLEVLANYPIIIGPDSSQNILINLLAETIGDYSQTVTIYSNDQQSPETVVTIEAVVVEGASPVKESTQILTVRGQVIGTNTGQVRVEILADAGQTVIHSQQGPVDDGSYRLTLLGLSNNLTPKFSNQNQIQAVLLDSDDNPIESTETEAIGLTTNQISSGLVELPTIALAPKISLEPVIDLEQIYVGVGKLFEFSLSNQGHVDLEINSISTSDHRQLKVLSDYPIIIEPDNSRGVLVNLLTETMGDYSQTMTIYSNDQQSPETVVTIEAVVVEGSPPVKESTQILTVSGQVIGTDTGRVRVEILAGADQTVIDSQQGPVDDGSYRLTLVDLSNNLTPKFSNQNQIRALLLDPDDNPIASMEIRDLTTSEISSGLVNQNFVANQPPIIKAEAQTSILMLSDQYLINLDDYFIDLDVNDFLSFKIERIQVPSFLALYDGPESNEVLQEEDQLVTNQLEVFMADLGQAEFEITAIDTKGDFVSTTIQVTREQLITVVDEIDFGTVLPGMSVERKLLIQNTASAEELYITNINSNLGPSLFITERPTPSNPLVLSAGQEAELTVTVLLDDSSSEFNVPRLIISSNEPDGGTTIIPINLEVGQLSIPTETNLMVVEGYVEKTSAQVYENLSVGVWVERGIEVDTDDDGLEDSWEEYNFNNDLTFTDGSQDSDGDDQDNWAEFHGRSDPNDVSSLPRYFEAVPVNNDGSYRMLLANLPTGSEPVSPETVVTIEAPVVAEGDTIFVYLDDQADKGSDEESYQITTTDIRDNFIQIDLEAVMTISKSIPIKGFDDPVVLTITDQIVGLKQPPRIQQVRTAEQERMVTKLQIGIQQGQPARQIETVLKIEVPGTTNTGIGGIFHETPLGIEIPFDTNKAEPVDVIALISIDSVNRSETVEILETEIIGNKLKAQLAHLSYVVTMKNTAPVFHASQANQSLEAIGATEDIQLNSRMLATNAGGDSQLLNLNGMFSDSDSEIGDQMTYEATSDNPELLNVAVVEGEVMQLMLETTDDKSQEGIAEISILVEDTNGATSEALIFYVDVASILPDHWQDEIDLQLGLNLFSLPLQPINQIGELEQWTAADLADKISATVIVSMDNGQFVPFIPQVMKNNDGSYLDQGFDLEGGKAYIINVLDDLTLTLDGQPWSNSPISEGLDQPLRSTETNFDDSSVRRAPNRVLAPWTFVISGDLITDSALSFGFDLSQISRIVAVDTRTGKELIGQLKGNRFHFVLADLTMQPVVMDGQSFDIRAEDVDGNLVAGPFNWQLNAEHLRQAYIHQEITIGDVIPSQTQLLPNYPNPFNPETWIPFELQQASDVQLAIFDSNGNIIRQLDLGHQIAGRYLSKNRAAYWDGNNQLGEQVSSGVYFYTFIADSEQSKPISQTRKMVILK